MEVTLLAEENLPEGCLLSIRSGSTRRQAAVDSKFKLFFPKGGKPGEDVKVDALLPVGTHVLQLKEGQQQYDMDMGGMKAAGMRVVNAKLTDSQAVEAEFCWTSEL
ncbi:unnamed protein product [Durusdinium trenchii]|uniref:Uncharacterized protein n=1 Tax=Durusdinium trenchii TaxID=1381693 RepID=A0ABP0R7T0_9DINO